MWLFSLLWLELIHVSKMDPWYCEWITIESFGAFGLLDPTAQSINTLKPPLSQMYIHYIQVTFYTVVQT